MGRGKGSIGPPWGRRSEVEYCGRRRGDGAANRICRRWRHQEIGKAYALHYELRTTKTTINDDDACEKPKRAGPVRGRMYCHDEDDDDITLSPRDIVVSTGCYYVATCPS